MAECILINPRSIYFSEASKLTHPLYAGILSLASFLHDNKHSVRMIDMNVEDEPMSVLRNYISKKRNETVLIGFSVMTSQIVDALQMAEFLKKKYPEIPIIFGGIHPTLFPEQILETKLVDFVCVGKGEHALLELLNSLKGGGDYENIGGLSFIDDSENIVSAKSSQVFDLEFAPFFNYDLFDYSKFEFRKISCFGCESKVMRCGIVLTGMGCPYKCSFCINSDKKRFLGKYCAKSAKRIVDEIEFLIKKYNIEYFDFSDENFFVNKLRIEEFIAEVKRRKLKFKWFSTIRANYISREYVNANMLKNLEEIGCCRLGIGAESGSQRILDKIKKEIKVEDIIMSAEMLSQFNITGTYSFMMGIPGETLKDVEMTFELIQGLKRINKNISIIGPQIFRPYPGCELYEECVDKYGYRSPGTLADWKKSLNSFTGYENISRLNWISDKKLIKRLSFYSEYMTVNVDILEIGFMKKLFLKILQQISLIRFKYKFFGFNFEIFGRFAYERFKRKAKK